MPVMKRVKGKATKIAYKILGMPSNIRNYKTKTARVVDERLNSELTSRVR